MAPWATLGVLCPAGAAVVSPSHGRGLSCLDVSQRLLSSCLPSVPGQAPDNPPKGGVLSVRGAGGRVRGCPDDLSGRKHQQKQERKKKLDKLKRRGLEFGLGLDHALESGGTDDDEIPRGRPSDCQPSGGV